MRVETHTATPFLLADRVLVNGYRAGIKLDKERLAVENFYSPLLNDDLKNWSR
jgi:hypothetical protein